MELEECGQLEAQCLETCTTVCMACLQLHTGSSTPLWLAAALLGAQVYHTPQTQAGIQCQMLTPNHPMLTSQSLPQKHSATQDKQHFNAPHTCDIYSQNLITIYPFFNGQHSRQPGLASTRMSKPFWNLLQQEVTVETTGTTKHVQVTCT